MSKLFKMNIFSAILLFFVIANSIASDCPAKKATSKLICYYSKLTHVDSCKCSHVILPANSDIKSIDRLREHLKGVKVLITVNEFNKGLVDILKSSKVDGIEIDLKKLDSKSDISDFISTVRSKLGSNLHIVLSVPPKAETLAKYYDFKALSKNADLFILQTAFLGASKNVTFHPSRLSGLWDMQNTDSVVDLVSGLGAPLSKLVITAPVQAFKFKLQNEKYTAPGGPALEVQSITRDELCNVMGKESNWTLERDQDQAGPYIFSGNQWIAFDDATSIDIKAKYARVRGLAGMALKDLSQDGGTKCESSILDAAFNGLSRQARAPRGAVLHSLEREILETPVRPLDTIQVSPYRISRVIDVEGNVHVIRKDTRTEFECSRQGYFVHPRSCGRFYRCVKFDQLSDEFSVFEFDCPAGLAFDNRVEVCVWPGSLPHASACAGSSEIAPVPRERFICPGEPGYYADPENCRWFFACLDHGKSPLSAYEFRCPFGLVYDESRLLCEWPWLVPKCGSGYAVASEVVYGGSGLVALDQYNGLGVLKVTALGGLHGPVQEPVAKVYSNVGLVSQGGSYLAGNGQLSLNAAQSLQNAGLLKTGYGLDGSVHGSGLSYTLDNRGITVPQSSGSRIVYTQGQDISSVGTHEGGRSDIGLEQIRSDLVYTQHQDTGYSNIQPVDASLLNTGFYQGNVAVSNLQAKYIDDSINGNSQIGVSLNGASQVGTAGIDIGSRQSYAGTTNVHLVNGLAENYQQNIATTNENAASGSNYENAQSSVAYNSGGSTYGTGISGKINIVGGGYSAVGSYGEDSNTVAHVTQSPITVSTVSSIPTVTSVPLPSLKVAAGFQSYRGGVVANVPELQYKIRADLATSRGHSGIANVSSSFANVVSSTPSTLIVQEGYQYPKPNTAFIEEPARATLSTVSSIQQNLASIQPAVNTYKSTIVSTTQRPLAVENVDLVVPTNVVSTQAPIIQQKFNLQPVVTTFQKPVVVSSMPVPLEIKNVNIQPFVTTYNVHKQENDFGGYNYPKPTIQFEESLGKTSGTSFTYQNAVTKNEGYYYSKPEVAFEEVPLKTVVQSSVPILSSTLKPQTVVEQVQPVLRVQPSIQTVVQPVVQSVAHPEIKQQGVSFTHIQKQHIVEPQLEVTSYNLPSSTAKPVAIVNQAQPVVQVQHTVSQPVINQQEISFANIQPQLQVTSYNVPSSTGKPFIVEQRPQIYVSSTPVSVQPVVKQQAAVSFSTIHQQETVQPQVQVSSYTVPSSTVKPVILKQTPSVVQSVEQRVVQPAIVSSFSISSNNEGYRYEKPTIPFEEKPTLVTYQQPVVEKTYAPVVSTYNYQIPVQTKPPVSTYSYKNVVQSVRQGYEYPKPAIGFEEVPASVTRLDHVQTPVVSGYGYKAPSIEKQSSVVTGYTYTSQSTVKPTVLVQSVVSSTPKSAIFIQNKPAVISSYSYTAPSTTTKPIVAQPVITYTSRPTVLQKQPSVVSSYSFSAQPIKNVEFSGYDYPKPAVTFVEEPKPVINYDNRQPVREEQFVAKKAYTTGSQSSSYQYTQQFNNVVNTDQQQLVESYKVPVQPAVSSYSFATPSSTVKPIVAQPVITYTPKPTVLEKQPAIVSSYSFAAQPVKNIEFSGYDYPKPEVQFVEEPKPVITYENRQPVHEELFVAKKAYVTGGQSTSYQYEQQFNNVVNNDQKQIVIENYKAPVQPTVVSTTPLYEYKNEYRVEPAVTQQKFIVSTTPRFEYRQQYSADSGYVYDKPLVQFEEKPVVVENYQAAVGTVSGSYDIDYSPKISQKIVSSTPKPIVDYTYVQSTPRPTLTSTIRAVVAAKQPFTYYDSRLQSTVRPVTYSTSLPVVESISTSQPISKFSFGSLENDYQEFSKTVENYAAPVEVTTTSRDYYLPPKVDVTPSIATTSRPIAKYSFSSFDSQYQQGADLGRVVENYVAPEVLEVTTPSRDYSPVKVIPSEEPVRIKVTTSAPEVITPAVRAKTRFRVTSTPSREYLPVRSRVRVTSTTPTSTYLPPDNDYELVSTRRPVKIVKVARPKTIVKVNDFHPLLSAKLGAQCTCISNPVNLRKKPLRIIVEEDDDDDGYVVDNDDQGVVVENYQYEPQKIVEITPTPEIYIKSTSTVEPSSTTVYSVRRRARVRPTTSTAAYDISDTEEANQLFVKNPITPAVTFVNTVTDDSELHATKAKTALESGKFDRYGPGGWRSRNEKLQGTIDCQRAGLFRHPTQCNKFYACRWDCTKNRYTLHVFNCPVHLTFDNNLGACNWPSQGPACLENTLLPSD